MPKSLILTINPGTTTTRIGLFLPQGAEVRPVLDETIDHDETVMAGFDSIAAQLPFRAAAVQSFLDAIPGGVRLATVAGRGGMLSPVPAGVIAVDDGLVDFALHRPVHQHASNLGAPLAQRIARAAGCAAFVVDPVSVDELPPVARVSGCPDIPRFSFVHALNIRACGRRSAAWAFPLARRGDCRFGKGPSFATRDHRRRSPARGTGIGRRHGSGGRPLRL